MTSSIVRALPKDAQHRLIAIRYNADARTRTRKSVAPLRLRELERIFQHRFGKFLPNDAEGRRMLEAYAGCLPFAKGSVLERLAGFINARAPWAIPEAKAMAEAAEMAARWQDADEMANRIGLSLADRELLEVRTIGAVGITKRQRIALQKEKRRKRDTKRRRDNGAKPRAEYEAQSISRAEPWKAEGISRRTWYRRQAKAVGTSPHHVSFLYITRCAPVPKSPRSGRDALRAGPKGPRPDGLRRSEQADGPGIYCGEEGSPGREFSGGESHTGMAAQPVLYQAVA